MDACAHISRSLAYPDALFQISVFSFLNTLEFCSAKTQFNLTFPSLSNGMKVCTMDCNYHVTGCMTYIHRHNIDTEANVYIFPPQKIDNYVPGEVFAVVGS